jgi:hypothetical protein
LYDFAVDLKKMEMLANWSPVLVILCEIFEGDSRIHISSMGSCFGRKKKLFIKTPVKNYQRRIFVRDGSIEKRKLRLLEHSSVETIRAWIPDSISILNFNCFNNYQKLLWISFE